MVCFPIKGFLCLTNMPKGCFLEFLCVKITVSLELEEARSEILTGGSQGWSPPAQCQPLGGSRGPSWLHSWGRAPCCTGCISRWLVGIRMNLCEFCNSSIPQLAGSTQPGRRGVGSQRPHCAPGVPPRGITSPGAPRGFAPRWSHARRWPRDAEHPLSTGETQSFVGLRGAVDSRSCCLTGKAKLGRVSMCY